MISTELLSLVLGEEIIQLDSKISNNMISRRVGYYSYSQWENLNLDTLGRLCKEWCLVGDYEISSKITRRRSGAIKAISSVSKVGEKGDKKPYTSNNELKAIIKATEWVAKEKGLL